MFSASVENILSIQKKRHKREEDIRNKVLSTLKDKIHNYANFGKISCVYTVPNFIIGYSLFDLNDMIKFLIKQLKKEGFCVKQLTSQHIFISWDIKDINSNLNKQKSKISQSNDNNIDYSAFINNKKGY